MVENDYGVAFFKEYTRDGCCTWNFSRVGIKSLDKYSLEHMLTSEMGKVIGQVNPGFRKEFNTSFEQVTNEGWRLIRILCDTTPRGRNDFTLHFGRPKDFQSVASPLSPLVTHPVTEEVAEEQNETPVAVATPLVPSLPAAQELGMASITP